MIVRFRSAAVATLAALAILAAASPARAAEIPPPTDGEIAKFVAIQKELTADASRASDYCSVDFSRSDEDEETPPDPDGARLGRELDAHAYFGPVLRRHSISGQRFAQVAVQIVAGALGLAIADSMDGDAKSKGQPTPNRDALLAKSPEARAVAAHYAELTASLEAAAAICGDGDDGENEEEAEN